MIVQVTAEGGATELALVDPTTFTALHVEAPRASTADLDAALGELGHVEGDHVWLEPAGLRALAGATADEAWTEGFEGMRAYAAEKGFTDGEGRIRAHVEWTD